MLLSVDAETLQQRAERHQKLELFNQAEEVFEEAIRIAYVESSPEFICNGNTVPVEQIQDCRCLFGELLQNKAELLLKLWSEQRHTGTLVHTLLGDYTLRDEAKVFLDASALFLAAASQYKATIPEAQGFGSMRVDCLVNLGNTLAEHASLLCSMLKEKMTGDIEQCYRLFSDSLTCYETAILKEEDASTWNNCADMLIAQAEFEAEFGLNARIIYEKAIHAYSRACELSSSEHGDNLPALLCDWGSGLLSFAEYMRIQGKDTSLSLDILVDAEKRLNRAISFDRGSTAPHTALGDVYIAMSEGYFEQGTLEDAWNCAESAINTGYGMALKIQRSHADALIGNAEALVQKAKIARARQIEVKQLLQEAASLYQNTFTSSTFSGSLRERADTLYNVACCLVALGREGPNTHAFQQALEILNQLIARHLISKDEILRDNDLDAIHSFIPS